MSIHKVKKVIFFQWKRERAECRAAAGAAMDATNVVCHLYRPHINNQANEFQCHWKPAQLNTWDS